MEDSVDMSRELESDRRIVKNLEENVQSILQHHNKTQSLDVLDKKTVFSNHQGSILILSQKLGISVGPHYMYLLIGFPMVLIVSLLLNYCTFKLIKNVKQIQNSYNWSVLLKVISVITALWVNSCYLLSAFLDPGIYTPGKLYISQKQPLKYCQICRFQVPSKVFHCYICNVCIIQLDHHCPWMSKCVGKNNLKYFYSFIVGIFLMVGTFWITLFLVLSQ